MLSTTTTSTTSSRTSVASPCSQESCAAGLCRVVNQQKSKAATRSIGATNSTSSVTSVVATSTRSQTAPAPTTDYSSALKSLRLISHALACKAVGEVAHNHWIVAGLDRAGITTQKVNDRIVYVKGMVSALNRAESSRLEDECRTAATGVFAMANGATFSHVKGHSRAHCKKGWNQGASRAGGRDKKVMIADAFYGDMDLDCDRLFMAQDGQMGSVE